VMTRWPYDYGESPLAEPGVAPAAGD
jgi:hypothetical protein